MTTSRVRWKALAGMAAMAAAVAPLAGGISSAVADPPNQPGPSHGDADQAPGGHLRRERLVRPLLRHLSQRHQPARRAGVPRRPGYAVGQRLVGALLTNNPNLANPQLLNRAQAATCDQDHGYTYEQKCLRPRPDGPVRAEHGRWPHPGAVPGGRGQPRPRHGTAPNNAVMDYYDGNTVTGLWNYAQNFAMSDNSYGTTFGPSSPGAINVTSGTPMGPSAARPAPSTRPRPAPCRPAAPPATPGQSRARVPAPCTATPTPTTTPARPPRTARPPQDIQMGGQNVGDLLNQKDQLGLVPGGLRQPRLCGRPAVDGQPGGGVHRDPPEHPRAHGQGLQPPPSAVPVLRVDGQPPAPAAHLGGSRSATRTRPTTSTTSRTSGRRRAATTCRRCRT